MQEQDYSNIPDVDNNTPKPVSPDPLTTINGIHDKYIKYFEEQNKTHSKCYSSGSMLAESVGDNVKKVFEALVSIVLYELSNNTKDVNQLKSITCLLNCMDELLKTINFDEYDVSTTKDVTIKLLGFITKLHKTLDAYKI